MTYIEESCLRMIHAPKTEIAKLIGQKWFNTLDKLSKESGVALNVLKKAVQGKKIAGYNERKLRAFLSEL